MALPSARMILKRREDPNTVDFLLRPASLILVMLLAFILRAAGIFTEVETHGVTKVALTITIPAAILCSFENFQ